MPILKSWSFDITGEVDPSIVLYVEGLSLRSVPLLIMAIRVCQNYMLKPFVPGRHDQERDPHQIPFEDLHNPA
jgi:hypothetical protein